MMSVIKAGRGLLSAASVAAFGHVCEAQEQPFPSQHAGHLVTGANIFHTSAYAEYCERENDCEVQTGNPRVFELTPKRWSALQETHKTINAAIDSGGPGNDQNLYGVLDYWAVLRIAEGGKSARPGDCDDYAVTKKDDLLKRGFPESSLLLLWVKYPGGQNHLVLNVRTTMGDFVLDNMQPGVLPATKLEADDYRFVAMVNPKNMSEFLNVEGYTYPSHVPGAGPIFTSALAP